MRGRQWVVIALALTGTVPSLALDPHRPLIELAHRSWTSKDGAPPNVKVLAQSTDGYLWVGTYAGLYRFDGTQFQPFDVLYGVKLPSREVRSLFASPDGKLWIGFRKGIVSVLDHGRLTNYDKRDGVPDDVINGFALDRAGRLWVADYGGLAWFDQGKWHKAGGAMNYPDGGAQAVLVDHIGMLWVATDKLVVVLAPNSKRFEVTDEPIRDVQKLAEAPDGTVWMAETSRAVRPLIRPGEKAFQGISRFECQSRFPDTYQTERACQRPNDLQIRVGSAGLLFDHDGTFWISTLGDGLRRAPDPSSLPKQPIGEFSHVIENFTNKDGLSADVGSAIIEDREGNIWLGTRDGIDQFRNSSVAPVVFDSSSGDYALAADSDGYVLAATLMLRTYRFHDALHQESISGLVPHGYIRDLSGTLWGLSTDGVCRIKRYACVVDSDSELPGVRNVNLVTAFRVAADNSGRLWAYVRNNGFFVRENEKWKPVPDSSPGMTGLVPTTEFTDPFGHIWFGFTRDKIIEVDNGVLRSHSSADGLALGDIKAIFSSHGNLWVGGDRGLALLDNPRFAAVRPYDSQAFEGVSGIVEADDGSLWLNENRGIICIPRIEVQRLLENRSHHVQYELFDSRDGLPGDTEQTGPFNTAIKGTDGRLWFAASRGVAWVDPTRRYRNDVPPPVVIEGVVADAKPLADSDQLTNRGTIDNLQIAYVGLSLTVPERVRYRYRLQGYEREWQDAGARRVAYYTKIPPGSYTFQVIASNNDGVWNATGAALAIMVVPAWYQTWWFYALCMSLGAASLWIAYRTRVAQIRAETRRVLEARLSERVRIARDLHDTLLQSMQGLILRFRAATDRIPPSEAARNLMEQALGRAGQVIVESRDRVKELRTPAFSAANLAAALAEAGAELAASTPTKFRYTVEGEAVDLHAIVHEEAFMIGREALTNAFVHAQAENVEAEVSYGPTLLAVRVRDDGCGIDPEVMQKGSRSGSYGLIGMRERAAKIRGEIEIWSQAGAGTEVILRVPSKVAYRVQASRHGFSRWRGMQQLFRSIFKSPPNG